MIKALIDIQNRTVVLFPSTVTIKSQALLIKEFDRLPELSDYLQQENLTLSENFTNLKLDINPLSNFDSIG